MIAIISTYPMPNIFQQVMAVIFGGLLLFGFVAVLFCWCQRTVDRFCHDNDTKPSDAH
jgi:hypothetical protein